MPMTLDQMLALLPDNTAGEISPADMRAIVSDLYEAAHTTGIAYAYKWTTSSPPPTGRVTMDQPWQLFASKALVSETADDGMTPGFGAIDNATAGRVWITTAAGAKYIADITGPSIDRGTYREIPIAPQSMTGNPPGNGDAVTVTLAVVGG